MTAATYFYTKPLTKLKQAIIEHLHQLNIKATEFDSEPIVYTVEPTYDIHINDDHVTLYKHPNWATKISKLNINDPQLLDKITNIILPCSPNSSNNTSTNTGLTPES